MENKSAFVFIVFFLLLVGTFKSKAQKSDSFNRKDLFNHRIGVSFISEHINVPFRDRLGEKTHLGGTISYTLSKQRTNNYQFSHNANLGYFHHQDFFRAYFFNYKPTFSFEFWETLRFYLPIGVGYARSFPTETSYKFKGGIYKEFKPKGKSHFMPSIGLGMSLKFDKILRTPFELFWQYEMFSLFPYAPKGSLPFTPHVSFTIGIKYQLK